MKFIEVKNGADKYNWTQAELEAYDYVLMREQDERGRMSFAIKKEISETDPCF